MWFNLKRYTIGAILLASLSLLIQGCGSSGGDPAPVDKKQITGTVSDPATSLPLPGATVIAYAIENGVLMPRGKALTEPVVSGWDGKYFLLIPATYTGSVQIVATLPTNILNRLAKLVFSIADKNIRAVVAASTLLQTPIPQKNLNIASEIVAVFIEQNIVNSITVPAGFTREISPENIQKATAVLETFFGPNFTEIQLPTSATDINTTKSQQDLLVSIAAFNIALLTNPNFTIDIVTSIATGGLGPLADEIKRDIATATTTLIQAGSLPPEYVPSATINTAISNAQTAPVIPPSLGDTTSPTPPAGLTATAINTRTISLAWTASTDNSGTVAGYSIYRADTSGVYTLIDIANSITYSDSTVSPATSYTYKIVAFDASRNYSVASNEAPVSTPALVPTTDTTSPSVPTGLVKKLVTYAEVNIQWGLSTKSDGSGVVAAGYYVYRDSRIVATVTDPFYKDTNVTPATEYTYYIKAFDSNANVSAASTPLSLKTPAAPSAIRPAAPSALALESAVYNKVILNWIASPTLGVTYNVYRGSDLIASGISSLRYSDSTVPPSSVAYDVNYYVTAANANGESLNTSSSTLLVPVPAKPTPITDPVPSVPQSFKLDPKVAYPPINSVALTWLPSTMPDGSNVAGYDILRAAGASNNFTVIATVRTPGYTDTSVVVTPQGVDPLTYSYQVRAFSSTGTRSPVANLEKGLVTMAPYVDFADKIPPTAPTNLMLSSAATFSSVPLTWTASTKSNNDKIVAGYRVYRNGLLIDDILGTAFTDITVAASTTYVYTVKAYDNPGNLSAPSNELPVTTPVKPAASFIIRGRVTLNDVGLPGLELNIGTVSTTTDTNGNYSFNVVNGSYTISASPATLAFAQLTPTSRTISVNSADVAGVNFTANLLQSVTTTITNPDGSVTTTTTYSSGAVTTTTKYPNGSVITTTKYPNGSVITTTKYPNGSVITTTKYPNGTITVVTTNPDGSVTTTITNPDGSVTATTTNPDGSVTATTTYPSGAITTATTYPNGLVTVVTTYPNGTVTSLTTYPAGSVTTTTTNPDGSVTTRTTYPNGSVTTATTYPNGSATVVTTNPNGIVTTVTTYPAGSVSTTTTNPDGSVTTTTTNPSGAVTTATTYPNGSATVLTTYSNGSVTTSTTYPDGTVTTKTTNPNGTVTTKTTNPNGTVTTTTTAPNGTVTTVTTAPNGTVTTVTTTSNGTVTIVTTTPNGTVTTSTTDPNGTVTTATTDPNGKVTTATTDPSGTMTVVVQYN
jgi:antitoxin component YwqK of YwqJK toxin-antitoxin module